MTTPDVDRVAYGKSGRLTYGAVTHPGRVRRRNEDTFWVDEERALFLVADGMGGHQRGAEAARSAVVAVAKAMNEPSGGMAAFLPLGMRQRLLTRRAIAAANEAVKSASKGGGGSTLVSLLVRDGRAFVAWVGDSRIYRLRAGKLVQVTRDHTLASERGAARASAGNGETDDGHAITRYLGTSLGRPRPDQSSSPLLPGDTYLLCSDGLSGLLPPGRIEALLAKGWGDALASSRALVDAALEAGGNDNVTVIVVTA